MSEESDELRDRLARGELTLDDFVRQLDKMLRAGGIRKWFKMIPGLGDIPNDLPIDEYDFKPMKAIVSSMTRRERSHPDIIDGSRRQRIARGSGTDTEDVDGLCRQFIQARDMMKRCSDLRDRPPELSLGANTGFLNDSLRLTRKPPAAPGGNFPHLRRQPMLAQFVERLERIVSDDGGTTRYRGKTWHHAGLVNFAGLLLDRGRVRRIRAILQSMTADERMRPGIINPSRRARIARGSGTHPSAVAELLNAYFRFARPPGRRYR